MPSLIQVRKVCDCSWVTQLLLSITSGLRSPTLSGREGRGIEESFTTIEHFWALCNMLPSIIPYMGSVWCYRNWIELEGIKMAPNYPVNLRWRVLHWLVRGFRVVDVARILHLRQIFVKKFRHFFRIKYPLGGLSYAADGKLAFNLVNKLNWSVK